MSRVSTVVGILARDLRRSSRQVSRVVGGLARPFMWLLLIGTGFNAITRVEGGWPYHVFVFPGIVIMAALFGGMLTAISTVYDREFGMLRLMLASPAGVPTLLAGRTLSAAVVGLVQGGVVLAFAPLLLDHVWTRLPAALGVLALSGLSSGALGLAVACRLRSVENFAGVINVVLFPLLFLSGALYPTAGMPPALRAVTLFNPVTYQVDLMRHALGLAGEHATGTSVVVLAVSSIAVFAVAARLFDPEQRFVGRVRRG